MKGGRGRILVSTQVWLKLGSPEEPEAWHKALLLPEGYEVEQVTHNDLRGWFALIVVHESIPVTQGDTLPDLVPCYVSNNSEHKTYLDRIEIIIGKTEA